MPHISRKDISLPEEGLESEVSSHLPLHLPCLHLPCLYLWMNGVEGRDLKAQTWGGSGSVLGFWHISSGSCQVPAPLAEGGWPPEGSSAGGPKPHLAMLTRLLPGV